MTTLVEPRWKPHRVGIRNIWEYDEQEFHFADGRMILRGRNGSGKSNALALIFPFLIDGEMRSAYMDPFGGNGGRSMKTLLLGVLRDDERSGYRHKKRLGYVWMEFAKSDPTTGDTRFHTIGCGANASAESSPTSWFFSTDRRVGHDLDLAPNNVPRTRGQLTDVIGRSAVFGTAEEYRSVVARDILGLEPEQLTKLVTLVRALRKPQLAGKLDLEELSSVLSSGLPEVSHNKLDDIAATLDDLDRIQEDLAAVQKTRALIEAFLPVYRRYLTSEAHQRVSATLAAEADRAAQVAERESRLAEQRSLSARIESMGQDLEAIRSQTREADAQRDALEKSDRYRDAQSLEDKERSASQSEQDADRAAALASRSEDELGQANERAERSRAALQQAHTESDQALVRASDAATSINAPWSSSDAETMTPAEMERALGTAVDERQSALREVQSYVDAVRSAAALHDDAQRRRSKAAERQADAEAKLAEARAVVDGERDAAASAIERWASTAPLVDDDALSVLLAVVDSVGTSEPLNLAEQYRALVGPARDDVVSRRSSLRGDIALNEQQRGDLEAQRDALLGQHTVSPPAPLWRSANREGRRGAPLWACCDVAPEAGLDEGERAGIEAALDAAGLLDAWIAPDGSLDGVDDSWLRPTGTAIAAGEGRRLSSVLVAQVPEGCGLSVEQVTAVLDSIALAGDSLGAGIGSGASVDVSGRFVLGPLRGQASKTAAEFIGATAREQRRQRLLAELDTQIDALRRVREELDSSLAAATAEIAAIDEATLNVPNLSALAGACGAVDRAVDRLANATTNAEDAARDEQRCAGARADAVRQLDLEAGRRNVPSDTVDLADFERKVNAFSRLVADVTKAFAEVSRQSEAASVAEENRLGAEQRWRRAHEDFQQARLVADAIRAEVDALRSALGSDAQSIFDEVKRLTDEARGLRTRAKAIEESLIDAREARGTLVGHLESSGESIARAQRHLASVSDRLAVLRNRQLLSVLQIDESDSFTDVPGLALGLPTEPVEFARWLGERLPGTTEGSRHGGQTGGQDAGRKAATTAFDAAYKKFYDELHYEYAPDLTRIDELSLVEVTVEDAHRVGPAELLGRLEAQALRMEEQLTESDRDLFERVLLQSVASELRRLLSEADDFVAHVNAALSTTSTASGLRVELKWAVRENTAEVRRALGLLRTDTDMFGADEREALGSFFKSAIQSERAQNPEAGYRANLENVVDYRRWHRFEPHLIGPDGRARLTREKFRSLSGGEQSVALHLPLFAAAAAHYNRAGADAPRLIALDEAFAGIDETLRGELLGLTVAFDLDVVLTGHELWGAYREVPHIAAYDLMRSPDFPGVNVMSFRWDGHTLAEHVDEAAVVELGGMFEGIE